MCKVGSAMKVVNGAILETRRLFAAFAKQSRDREGAVAH